MNAFSYMKNKHAGFLLVSIAIVIAFIVVIFNIGLKEIVNQTCDHGSECVMYSTLALQTSLGLGIALLIAVIGLFLIISKEPEKIIIKKVKEKLRKKKIDLRGLDKDEKVVIKILQEEHGAIFQKTLMEKLEVGKVKITRLLDKLEAKQFLERKRRGMNNIVVLRQ